MGAKIKNSGTGAMKNAFKITLTAFLVLRAKQCKYHLLPFKYHLLIELGPEK
jgi:predicted nucleic-acid-binding Zn-ribbon protein